MTATDVRKLRKDLNLTQGELAHTLGTEVSTVSRWERGLHSPQGITLKQLRELQPFAETTS